MARQRFPKPYDKPAFEPPPDLERILCDMESPDERTRANAVRELCPCRGVNWGVPVFRRVLELRSDPSPIVRHAVRHDLSENPDWNERQEARRLQNLRQRREEQIVRDEIETGWEESAAPPPHTMAWHVRRRPRVKKSHYPRGRR